MMIRRLGYICQEMDSWDMEVFDNFWTRKDIVMAESNMCSVKKRLKGNFICEEYVKKLWKYPKKEEVKGT